ncbi:MAG: 6-hydroxymethylpterin diphosphokinase MptE-like protein [Anaerolineaceae bacterium]
MPTFKENLKKILPVSTIKTIGSMRDSMVRLQDVPAAYFHPWRAETRKNLKKFQGIHQGKRCFIIGNGPSLRNTDLSKLKDEYTIGMNRIYLMFPELGFTTSYYLSVNDLVIEQCAKDIQALKMPRFVSWRSRQWLKPDPELYFLYTTYTGQGFSSSAGGRLWEGATVTYVALQLAFYLGFEQVILIGVDHNFETKGKPNTTIISQGDDPNHFSPAYFGKGFRWQLPDLETSELAYGMAREAYEKHGRTVVDATVGGKLTVFEKVDYNSLFSK